MVHNKIQKHRTSGTKENFYSFLSISVKFGPLLHVFPIKRLCSNTYCQNLPCHKIGQGQLRVIIYINPVDHGSPKLHITLQVHRTSGSRRKFLKVSFIWAWQPSWSCELDHLYQLLFPHPRRLHKNLALIGQAVSEEKMFEHCEWLNDA